MSGENGQWGDEWNQWATAGGDQSQALKAIIEKNLNQVSPTPEELDKSEEREQLENGRQKEKPRDEEDLEDTMDLAGPIDECAEAEDGKPATPAGRRRMAAALLSILLGSGLILGGASIWHSHEQHAAQASCAEAAEKYSQSLKHEASAIKTWHALKPDQQDDAKTIALLNRAALKAAKPETTATGCPADRNALKTAAGRMGRAAATNDANAETLEDGIGAVHDQRPQRQFSQDRNELVAKRHQAQGLYGLSASNVADDATRSALSQQIDAAGKLLGNKKAKASDLQGASQALDAAMNAVNASVQAKAQADAQAQNNPQPQADTQSQAESTEPAPAPAPSRPQTAVPQQRGQVSAPAAPSAPSTPQGGGGGWYVPPAGNNDGGLPDHL